MGNTIPTANAPTLQSYDPRVFIQSELNKFIIQVGLMMMMMMMMIMVFDDVCIYVFMYVCMY